MKKTKKEHLTPEQRNKLCDHCEACRNCGFCAGGYTSTCESLRQFAIANRIPLITV